MIFRRSAYQRGRHVRILAPDFGYGNKIGTITSIGQRFIYVRIKLGRKPHEWDEIAYLPEHLRLVQATRKKD